MFFWEKTHFLGGKFVFCDFGEEKFLDRILGEKIFFESHFLRKNRWVGRQTGNTQFFFYALKNAFNIVGNFSTTGTFENFREVRGYLVKSGKVT